MASEWAYKTSRDQLRTVEAMANNLDGAHMEGGNEGVSRMMTKPGIYWWVRDVDETGMSGVGPVAQVAVFEDGSAVLRWIKDRNSAGVASTCLYETVEQLIHVHGHGGKNTGHLEPAYCIGDVVVWHCIEGFGGVAEVLAVRNAEPSVQVKILEPHWTEHSYQPESWACRTELTRKVR